jgi:hypothetical protein
MELTKLSPDMKEIRDAVISSNLTSCYLILEALTSLKGDTLPYDRFRGHWLETYKGFKTVVGKMKARTSRR